MMEYCRRIVADYEKKTENLYDDGRSWWFQGKMSYDDDRLKKEIKVKKKEYLDLQNELTTLLSLGNIDWPHTPAFIDSKGEITSPTTIVALAMKAFELCIYEELDVLVLITNSYALIPMVEKVQARGIPVIQVSFNLDQYTRPGNGLGRVCDHAAYINSETVINSKISQDTFIQHLFDITLYPKPGWGNKSVQPLIEPTTEHAPDSGLNDSQPVENQIFPKTIIRQSKLNDDEDPF